MDTRNVKLQIKYHHEFKGMLGTTSLVTIVAWDRLFDVLTKVTSDLASQGIKEYSVTYHVRDGWPNNVSSATARHCGGAVYILCAVQ